MTSRRRELHRRDPHCHWCDEITCLNSSLPPNKGIDPYLATVDHLKTRAMGRQGLDTPNTVLSCTRCNATRNQIETKWLAGKRVDQYPAYLVDSIIPYHPPRIHAVRSSLLIQLSLG